MTVQGSSLFCHSLSLARRCLGTFDWINDIIKMVFKSFSMMSYADCSFSQYVDDICISFKFCVIGTDDQLFFFP